MKIHRPSMPRWLPIAAALGLLTLILVFMPFSATASALATSTGGEGEAALPALPQSDYTLAQSGTVTVAQTFADFEGAPPPGFFVYNGGASSVNPAVQTVGTGDSLALPGQVGDNGVLQTSFTIGDFGGFGADFSQAGGTRDWEGLDGIAFWFYGSNAGLSYQFEIQDNRSDPNSDTAERFDYNFTDNFSGWQYITIPFADFQRATDFQPSGAPNDGLTLTAVWGWAFPLPAGSSTFALDDVSVYGDPANITTKVAFAQADFTVTEGATAMITATLNMTSSNPVTVAYATANGTATSGVDYTATSGQLVFAPGEISQSFGVATLDNTAQDGNRTLTLTLSNPNGATLGAQAQAMLTIQDNEVATPGMVDVVDNFEAGAPTGADGNGIPLGYFIAQDGGSTTTFTATQSLPVEVPGVGSPNTALAMTFDVTAYGVVIRNFANASFDTWMPQDWSGYEAFSLWLYGQNSGTDLFIDIIENRNPGSTTDDAERFTVTFKDDFSGWRYLEFPFNDFVRKDIGNGAPNDGFARDEVYGWAFGTLNTGGPLTLYMDQVGVVVRETVIDDFEAPLPVGTDPNGVPLGFFNAQDGGSSVGFARSTTPPAPVPSAGEANSALQVDFDVSAFGVVIHNFANAAVDTWTPQNWASYAGIGFWLYGQNTGTDLFLDVIDNRTAGSTGDDAERFSVGFKDDFSGWRYLQFAFSDFTRKDIGNGAPNDGFGRTEVYGYAFGALNTGGPVTYYLDNVTIYGNTGADRPLEIGFGTNSYNVNEGDTATILVKLTRATESEVRVDYATSDSSARTATEESAATADRDYTPVSGTLVFAPGETEQSFTVMTLDDRKHEVGETIILTLANAVGVTLGMVDDATLSITDNDPVDPALVDDFELFPYMLEITGSVTMTTSELITGTADALPGQDTYETVLDVTYDSTNDAAGFGRTFPQAEDWSGYNSLTMWVYGTGSGETLTVELLDNQQSDPGPVGWELVWSDEFNAPAGTPPDSGTWTQETGGWGWGNSEFQYYTEKNAAHDGEGNMVITTREVNSDTTELECWYGPCTHTSARLISENKAEFAYGRFEARLKVPQGAGIWPAFWMLGANFREVGWPQTGEIDIMEFVGRIPNEIFGTIHGPGYSGGASYGGTYTLAEPVYEQYHTYAVEWEPELIRWYIDGILYHTAVPSDVAPHAWVFDHPFFLLLNVAVGGNFGGDLGPDLVFPQTYHIDYVRVFQAPDTAERFAATFVDDFTGWKQITLPFSAFTRSSTQPANAPDDGLTLREVWGYNVMLPANNNGSYRVDQMRLSQAGGTTPEPGNCNADAEISASDINSVILEIFDGDGNSASNAANGSFAGNTACDANEDSIINAADISCTVLIVFNGPGTCVVN